MCLSVRKEQRDFHQTDFRETLYLEVFIKFVGMFQLWPKSSDMKERRWQICYVLRTFPNLFYLSIELVTIFGTRYVRRRKLYCCQDYVVDTKYLGTVQVPGLSSLGCTTKNSLSYSKTYSLCNLPNNIISSWNVEDKTAKRLKRMFLSIFLILILYLFHSPFYFSYFSLSFIP